MSKTLTMDLIIAKCKTDRLTLVKNINLWGNDLREVSMISQMHNLEVVSLSVNKISTLSPFKNLRHLRELHLRKNDIQNLEELFFLCDLSELRVLSLSENPIAQQENYKNTILEILPNLTKLDDKFLCENEPQIGRGSNINNSMLRESRDNLPSANSLERFNDDRRIRTNGSRDNDDHRNSNNNHKLIDRSDPNPTYNNHVSHRNNSKEMNYNTHQNKIEQSQQLEFCEPEEMNPHNRWSELPLRNANNRREMPMRNGNNRIEVHEEQAVQNRMGSNLGHVSDERPLKGMRKNDFEEKGIMSRREGPEKHNNFTKEDFSRRNSNLEGKDQYGRDLAFRQLEQWEKPIMARNSESKDRQLKNRSSVGNVVKPINVFQSEENKKEPVQNFGKIKKNPEFDEIEERMPGVRLTNQKTANKILSFGENVADSGFSSDKFGKTKRTEMEQVVVSIKTLMELLDPFELEIMKNECEKRMKK